MGADAEAVWLFVHRVSTSGDLRGVGAGARLLGGVDLVRLGRLALAAEAEVTLDVMDPFGNGLARPAAVQAGASLRF